jgi:hypothetical protein
MKREGKDFLLSNKKTSDMRFKNAFFSPRKNLIFNDTIFILGRKSRFFSLENLSISFKFQLKFQYIFEKNVLGIAMTRKLSLEHIFCLQMGF